MSDITQKRIEDAELELEQATNGLKKLDGSTVMTADVTCAKCGSSYKQWTREMTSIITIKTITKCPVCAKEKLEDIKNSIEAVEKRVIEIQRENLINDLAIPKRFQKCTFENYQAVNEKAQRNLRICKAYADKWPERLENGGGMVMVGKCGTGKNHLAIAIAKQVINKHLNSVKMTSVLEIIRDFRGSWKKDSGYTEESIIDYFTSPDLLIIDEVGVQYNSDSERLVIFEIINNRYEEMRPTILISNETRENLISFVGERVIDRMTEGGGCELVFDWESYRAKI